MFFQSLIYLLHFLCVFNLAQSQVILDQTLLRSAYSSFGSVTSIDFTEKSIIHVDHNTFSGVNSVQTINLSNNAIQIIGHAFNPYYYYLVYATALYSSYVPYYAMCYNTGTGTNDYCAPATHFKNLLTINLSKNKLLICSLRSSSFL